MTNCNQTYAVFIKWNWGTRCRVWGTSFHRKPTYSTKSTQISNYTHFDYWLIATKLKLFVTNLGGVPHVNFKRELKPINLTPFILLGTFCNGIFNTFSKSLIYSFLRLYYRQKLEQIKKKNYSDLSFFMKLQRMKNKIWKQQNTVYNKNVNEFSLYYDCSLQLFLFTWTVCQSGPCTHIMNRGRIYSIFCCPYLSY